MYQRIFVPIDTSATSSAILEEVKQVAYAPDAKVCLVKVIDTAQFAISPGELVHELHLREEQRLLDERRENIRHFLADRAEALRAAGLDVETHLVEKFGGKISDAILEEAGKWGADLVVMGTHGRGGLAHLLLGSVAEEVVRHIRVPLLLVRMPAQDD